MLRLVSGLAFILALIVPAHAESIADLKDRCSAQPTGTLEIDGATATAEQMKAVREEVQTFVNVAQDYISCVSLYANAETKTLSAGDKQKLLNVVAQVADEKEEVGCNFQKQLDVYNKKHNLPGVEFDQICLDRFARAGTAPASTTAAPAAKPAPAKPAAAKTP
jgi:hypothetical protein